MKNIKVRDYQGEEHLILYHNINDFDYVPALVENNTEAECIVYVNSINPRNRLNAFTDDLIVHTIRVVGDQADRLAETIRNGVIDLTEGDSKITFYNPAVTVPVADELVYGFYLVNGQCVMRVVYQDGDGDWIDVWTGDHDATPLLYRRIPKPDLPSLEQLRQAEKDQENL